MNVTENLTNEEVNAALMELFSKVEGLGCTIDELKDALNIYQEKVDVAIATAKAAKEGLKAIKVTPTNGYDVAKEIIDVCGNVAITLGIVGLFVFIIWVMVKSEMPEKPEKEKVKIKIE